MTPRISNVLFCGWIWSQLSYILFTRVYPFSLSNQYLPNLYSHAHALKCFLVYLRDTEVLTLPVGASSVLWCTPAAVGVMEAKTDEVEGWRALKVTEGFWELLLCSWFTLSSVLRPKGLQRAGCMGERRGSVGLQSHVWPGRPLAHYTLYILSSGCSYSFYVWTCTFKPFFWITLGVPLRIGEAAFCYKHKCFLKLVWFFLIISWMHICVFSLFIWLDLKAAFGVTDPKSML